MSRISASPARSRGSVKLELPRHPVVDKLPPVRLPFAVTLANPTSISIAAPAIYERSELSSGNGRLGRTYLDLMVDVALPTLLSPGNLPALAGHSRVEFTFYTRPEDEEVIRASFCMPLLEECAEVRFEDIKFDETQAARVNAKYFTMARVHALAGKRAASERACAIILAPDAIFSDGSLRTVLQAAQEGKRAVMALGPRITLETSYPALKALRGEQGGEDLIAPAAENDATIDGSHSSGNSSLLPRLILISPILRSPASGRWGSEAAFPIVSLASVDDRLFARSQIGSARYRHNRRPIHRKRNWKVGRYLC